MGVLQNIYCIPHDPPEPKSLRSFAAAIESEGLVSGPFLVGSAERELSGHIQLISPEMAEYRRQEYDSHSTLAEAVERLIAAGAGLLSMTAIAARFRQKPEHFYDWPASLGIYLLPGGHDLCVGSTDDDLYSDEESEAEPAPPVFSGKVHGCIWLHGKNAPLLEDFIDSDLHRVVLAIWPDATIVEDCWL